MLLTIIYIIILVLMEALAIDLIVKWRNDKQTYRLISAVVIYALVALFLAYILTNTPSVAIANSLWQSLNIIIITFIAIMLYKERLTNYQKVGIGLAILAVLVTSYEDLFAV